MTDKKTDKEQFIVVTTTGDLVHLRATDAVDALKTATTTGNDYAEVALSEKQVKDAYNMLEEDEYYPVIKLHKEDLKEFLPDEKLKKLSKEDMAWLADKIGSALMDVGYWDVVETIVKDRLNQDK